MPRITQAELDKLRSYKDGYTQILGHWNAAARRASRANYDLIDARNELVAAREAADSAEERRVKVIDTYESGFKRHLEEFKAREAELTGHAESLRDENTNLRARVAKLERFIDDVATLDPSFAERFARSEVLERHRSYKVIDPAPLHDRLKFDDVHTAAERKRTLDRQAADDKLIDSFRPTTKPVEIPFHAVSLSEEDRNLIKQASDRESANWTGTSKASATKPAPRKRTTKKETK